MSAMSSASVVVAGRSCANERIPAASVVSALVAHVDLRSCVVADQHDGEPGWRMAGRDARRHRLAHFRRQPLGAALAVDDARGHL